MKKIIFLFAILVFGLSNAQDISDYKYISIPQKFSDFKKNEYSLNNHLRILLKQKKYEPIGEQHSYWPEEAKLNPCRVITADLLDKGTLLKNKLQLVFKDCNNAIIYTIDADSDIKEFEEGNRDALQKIVAQIKESNSQDYLANPTKNEVTIITKTTTPNPMEYMVPENKKTKPTTKTNVIKEENVSLNNKNLKIVELDNDEIVVIDAKNSDIIAHFYPSSKKGIYHVKIKITNTPPYYTIGYKDDKGKLSYEQTTDFQKWDLIYIN